MIHETTRPANSSQRTEPTSEMPSDKRSTFRLKSHIYVSVCFKWVWRPSDHHWRLFYSKKSSDGDRRPSVIAEQFVRVAEVCKVSQQEALRLLTCKHVTFTYIVEQRNVETDRVIVETQTAGPVRMAIGPWNWTCETGNDVVHDPGQHHQVVYVKYGAVQDAGPTNSWIQRGSFEERHVSAMTHLLPFNMGHIVLQNISGVCAEYCPSDNSMRNIGMAMVIKKKK